MEVLVSLWGSHLMPNQPSIIRVIKKYDPLGKQKRVELFKVADKQLLTSAS